MELISIIIPVYKAERYLCACVDSVLASTYPNLEIILVDDGSPDSCPQICDDYAAKDHRIKVIHQQNQGLSAARNAGLEIAAGMYVAFVDSDDVVSPLLYERLVAAIESVNADWAACEFTRKMECLTADPAQPAGEIRMLCTKEQQLSVLVCAPRIRNITWTNCNVWDKLYRRDLIHTPFLLECSYTEDLQFNWDYLKNSRTLAVIPDRLYYYRVNDESLTETFRKHSEGSNVNHGISMAKVYDRITRQLPVSCSALERYMISRTVSTMHRSLLRVHIAGMAKPNKAFVDYASQYIRKHWKTVWQEKETHSLKAKLPVTLFKFAYPLWILATKLFRLKTL